ncbi:MAG: TRAP transporter substrate-binding protein [candidate division NC10 bacterium]|nr:TRAP transporter substrate-binding protein [candidate division NC10 bacterium]
MWRKLWMVIVGMVLILWIGGWAVAGEKVVIKLGHHHAPGGVVDQTANKFKDVIRAKSGGTIEVQVFPGAQLGQEMEAIDGVHLGTVDMSIVSPSLMGKYHPAMGLDALPYLFDDWKHVDRALNGPVGAKMAELMLKRSNIRILRFLHLGFRDMLFVEKKIESADQMRGLKMRSPEAWAWIRMYELLGSKPTPITWGEVYSALQTKVVEGVDAPPQMFLDMKFFEVSDHINWNVANPAEQAAYQKLKERGITVSETDRTAWRTRVLSQHEEFVKQKGPEAKELLDMVYKLSAK